MKRACGILFVVALALCLSGCTPEVETITEKTGNYQYRLKEALQILDIETNEKSQH